MNFYFDLSVHGDGDKYMAMQTNEFSQLLEATETQPATETSAGWVALILRELGQSQATGFMTEIAKWSLLGALLGIMLAVAAGVLFSRLGWYELNWRFARGLRWTIFTVTILLAAGCVGLAGFWHGTIRGSERVLTKSQLATEVFPPVADAITDGMAWVQIRAVVGPTNSAEIAAKLEAFRAGKWELHALQFLQQLDALQADVITNALARMETSALEHTPQLKGGLGEKTLRALLRSLGGVLVEKKVPGQLKQYGAARIYYTIREQLPREAAKAGDPATLARPEISALIVRDGIVPGLMKPLHSFARSQQMVLAGTAFIVLIVPPLCVRLARSRFGRATPTGAPPPPAPTAFP